MSASSRMSSASARTAGDMSRMKLLAIANDVYSAKARVMDAVSEVVITFCN